MAGRKIVDLRKLLAERFPHETFTAAGRLTTGILGLDQALDGGLVKGAITELTTPRQSSGSASIIAALLRRARTERYFMALIDGRDSFDPQSIAPAALRHLLWVRCTNAPEAVQAADLLLRDGNFPLVILDLVLNPIRELGKIPSANWYRLQRLVEPAPVACLVLSSQSLISSARWKLVLENRWRLPHLDRPTEELTLQFKFRMQRAQSNHYRQEEVAC